MKKGIITMWALVFGTVFLIMAAGLVGFLAFQMKENQKIAAHHLAFQIAEAGLNFSRWRLSHSPEDFNFSGIYDYRDPEGSVIGHYQLEITSSTACEPGVKIFSIGWKKGFEEIKRKLQIIYVKTSLAKYSFLTNSNVWFGEDEELKGPFHSNGGIRMDGAQNSLSTSAKETYICGIEHGCNFLNCSYPCSWITEGCQCPGIWGGGEGEEKGLWEFPVSSIDFNRIIQDLALLKTEAETTGIYLPESDQYGYHLKFESNGRLEISKVTKLKPQVWGYDGQRWVYESNDIETKTHYESYSLPAECGPIFIEDNIWVEGDINGRITVVAAKLPETPASLKKIIISNNINYIGENSVLGLIAQKDILIPLYSPNNLEIKAAMLAQKGHVFRYYYPRWPFEPYRTYAIREYIETYGSIITNTIWTFTWVDWMGRVVSGYRKTEMVYNENLTYSPPPYFPVSSEYEIIKWQEIE